MKTPFKLRSGNTISFKNMGSSPAKQTTLEEKALQSKIAKEFKLPVSKKGSMPKGFNVTGSKASTTPGYSTTKKGSMPKSFNRTGSSKAGKFAKVAKKAIGKAGKFLGGKDLGVAGMMMATSSKADQPKKGKGSYTGDITKMKGYKK